MDPFVQAPAVEKAQVFKSRWGFHSVSREDFLVLKEIHRHYWRTTKTAYAWKRWQAKKPHNRRGIEPKFDSIDSCFVDVNGSCSLFFYTNGVSKTVHMPCNLIYRSIVQDFKNARTPCKNEKDVKPIDMKKYREIAGLIGAIVV